MSHSHSPRKHIHLMALLLFCLGLGNILYGASKRSEYRELLHSAMQESGQLRDRTTHSIVSGSQLGSVATAKFSSRMDFYSFVVSGGKVLAGLGLLLLLLPPLYFRRSVQTSDSDNK